MPLSGTELAQPAAGWYQITIIGDAVFLEDCRSGHKLYMGSGKPLSRPELRSHVSSLNQDLKSLSIGDFFAKYGLSG